MTVKIVDALCGAGKSTKMFSKIRKMNEESPDQKFIYVTPYLKELEERVPVEMPKLQFKNPKNMGSGKRVAVEHLIERGDNVACTHVLFSSFTKDIVDMMIEKQYILVIDEALSCMGLLNDYLVSSDCRDLMEAEMVRVLPHDRNRLEWNDDKYAGHDGRYKFVRDQCLLGTLYSFRDQWIMFELPPTLLKNLKEVWVLTYKFSGSDMRCWLDLNGVQYEYIDHAEFGLRCEEEIKQEIRDNLEVFIPRSLRSARQRPTTLSKGWFDKAKGDELRKYKGIMESFVNYHKVKTGEVFWTTFKDYRIKLGGKGYSRGTRELDAFIPWNTRATNDYRNYTHCMYAANIYKNPIEIAYLEHWGVEPREDEYALSNLIQFIFRGCVRQNEKMKVMILSTRMRSLLEDWLNE